MPGLVHVEGKSGWSVFRINYTVELAFIWENNTDNHIKQKLRRKTKDNFLFEYYIPPFMDYKMLGIQSVYMSFLDSSGQTSGLGRMSSVQISVLEESVLKSEILLFPLPPLLVIKIDVGSLALLLFMSRTTDVGRKS